MKYSASLDNTTKIMTAAITLIFAGILVYELQTFNRSEQTGFIIISAILAITYGSAYLYRPTGYTITEHELIIHRPINNVRYAREVLESVQVIVKKDLQFTIRTFGVGGLWGYYGYFYNSVYGKMIWFITRRDHLVLIKTANKRAILLSPDDIDSFTNELNPVAPVIS
ncbi:PH domain-containing protein [Dyadobacter jiangsuensis]|uniref:PH (Pleckstrin Homology) domain-containing protein n=1 Tax=Dyadobacter jiangsuensis TaxID=1591085 RepID=A0A2P8FZR8_9BACT|nr:PH domain-containing protein [Dyadobacter jiangsuensis]PSL27207.1 PH (Pleckstrin Homology) domain-containing protein [Dyadobacter jiangsuensis]